MNRCARIEPKIFNIKLLTFNWYTRSILHSFTRLNSYAFVKMVNLSTTLFMDRFFQQKWMKSELSLYPYNEPFCALRRIISPSIVIRPARNSTKWWLSPDELANVFSLLLNEIIEINLNNPCTVWYDNEFNRNVYRSYQDSD